MQVKVKYLVSRFTIKHSSKLKSINGILRKA